jgi:hypothetical protein
MPDEIFSHSSLFVQSRCIGRIFSSNVPATVAGTHLFAIGLLEPGRAENCVGFSRNELLQERISSASFFPHCQDGAGQKSLRFGVPNMCLAILSRWMIHFYRISRAV